MPQEQGYIVERSTDGGATWGQLADLPAGAVSYAHTGLAAGTTRHYRIKAKGNGTTTADSPYSNVVSATTEAMPAILSTSGDMVFMRGGSTAAEQMEATDSAESFNVGSGDFTAVWRGMIFGTPGSSARAISKGTGTQGFLMYISTARKVVAGIRVGSTTIHMLTYDTPLNVGEAYTIAFLRKDDGSGNLNVGCYKMVVNGQEVETVKSFATLPSANLDNTAPFYVGWAGTGNSPFAGHELAAFYKRALSIPELAALQGDSLPTDGAIWNMGNATFSGDQIPSLGTLGTMGVLKNFTTASLAPATRTAFSRGKTAIRIPAGGTVVSKALTEAYTLSRIVLLYASTGTSSVTYKVYNTSNEERFSGTATFAQVEGNFYEAAIPALNVQAGERLEVEAATSAVVRIFSFF